MRSILLSVKLFTPFPARVGEINLTVPEKGLSNRRDRNFTGVPGKPGGASNDARGGFGPPAFLDAVFHVGDNVILQTIHPE